VSDIANNEVEVKATYTRMYKLLNKTIQAQLEASTKCNEQEILATTAMMIGGVAIGRALNNNQLTSKLLSSCRQQAQEILKLDKL
jgi:TetR/AcrR family transcriptional repressor of nem operon